MLYRSVVRNADKPALLTIILDFTALVAGLAGVAIAADNTSGYIASGLPPKLVPEGYIVEGYIVNPRRI